MRALRNTALIVISILALAPGCALADEPTNFMHWLQVAQAYWNATPDCPGGLAGITIVGDDVPAELGGFMAASTPGCMIHWEASNPPTTDHVWCLGIAHEYGHLLGYGHTQNPTDVMYAGGPWQATVPGCPAWPTPPLTPAQIKTYGPPTGWCKHCGDGPVVYLPGWRPLHICVWTHVRWGLRRSCHVQLVRARHHR